MPDKSELLIEHYERTYELTYKLWVQRNRTFLVLVGAIAAATLLGYRPEGTTSLLVAAVIELLDITDETTVTAIKSTFPFALLSGVFLTIVFYLMVNLCHRALYVLRNYAYLGALENEIRESLRLDEASVAFTREGEFYWNGRPRVLSTVKWFYVALLGGLVTTFLYGHIANAWESAEYASGWVPLVAVTGIAFYFLAYARYTLGLDSREAIVGETSSRRQDKQPGTEAPEEQSD